MIIVHLCRNFTTKNSCNQRDNDAYDECEHNLKRLGASNSAEFVSKEVIHAFT